MSATQPIPSQPAAGSDQRPYEPSMEEILASIRRIIADDQSMPGRLDPRDPAGPGADAPEPRVAAVHHLRDQHDEARVTESPVAESAVAESSVAESPVAESYAAAPNEAEPDPRVGAMRAATKHVEGIRSEAFRSEALRSEAMRVGAMRVEAERMETMMEPHGAVAAPQFASPEGPRAPAGRPLRLDEPSYGADAPLDAAPGEDESADALDYGVEAEDDDFAGRAPAANGRHRDASPVSTPHEAQPAPPLFSASTDQSVASAFNVLAATRLADNSDELLTLARDMIRPLLQTWLDDNLPSMVERMVRAEIERVARGGR